MNADPSVQLRLLDLQAADSAAARLAHRRATLPQLAELSEVHRGLDDLALQIVQLETALADVDTEQRKLETEVDGVRSRAAKDEQRLAAGGLPAKELSNLQHEVTSLARRQSTLEDDLLEVMEQREGAQTELAAAQGERTVAEQRRDRLQIERDDQFADIDHELLTVSARRDTVAAEIPADLLALYDRIRASAGGVGAAAVHQRRCEGCRIELSGSELSAARNAGPDAVLRCENCRRILVRTADSGL